MENGIRDVKNVKFERIKINKNLQNLLEFQIKISNFPIRIYRDNHLQNPLKSSKS